MFQNEIDDIINHLLLSGLYDRCVYKYEYIEKPLVELFPEKNNYKIRKIIYELIKKDYLFQITKSNNKSYLYQLNNKDCIKPKKKEEPDLKTPLIVNFD
jgi:hypothetical protein